MIRGDGTVKQIGLDEYRVKMKEWHGRTDRHRVFKIGDQVYMRNYADEGGKFMPEAITNLVS